MPIIVDDTPWDSEAVSQIGAGLAAEVMRRRRAQEDVADRMALDTAATDNNIRQTRAAGDYAIGQLPQRLSIENAAAVNHARAMLPVQGDAYRQEQDIHQQVMEQALARQRAERETQWGQVEAGMRKAGLQPHVQPWMLTLAKNDFLDGRLDKGTYDLLRPRTPGEQLAEAEQAGRLKLFQQSVEAPERAAEAYRSLRSTGLNTGPLSPQDEYLATGLAQGHFKLSDAFVRERLGLLTPGEETAQTRAAAGRPADYWEVQRDRNEMINLNTAAAALRAQQAAEIKALPGRHPDEDSVARIAAKYKPQLDAIARRMTELNGKLDEGAAQPPSAASPATPAAEPNMSENQKTGMELWSTFRRPPK